MTGFLVMTFGDGLAGLIGKNTSSPTWLVINQKKSFLGTLTMFITSLIILFSCSYLGGYGIRFNLITIAIIAIAIIAI